MRYILNEEPNIGETRIKRKFLLIPRCLGRDWRWLEMADIVERFCGGNMSMPYSHWEEIDFVDNRTTSVEDAEE